MENRREPYIGDIVVSIVGEARGWGRIVAVDPEDETIVYVSWDFFGIRKHLKAHLQVVDITDVWSKAYIDYLYGGGP